MIKKFLNGTPADLLAVVFLYPWHATRATLARITRIALHLPGNERRTCGPGCWCQGCRQSTDSPVIRFDLAGNLLRIHLARLNDNPDGSLQ